MCMRIGIVSDIHGYSNSFRRARQYLLNEGIDELWCLGDVLGGPQDASEGAFELQHYSQLCLLGNHDLLAMGAHPHFGDYHIVSNAQNNWAQLLDGQQQWMKTLHPFANRHGMLACHGSVRDSVWEFVSSREAAQSCLMLGSEKIQLVGHTHQRICYQRAADGTVKEVVPSHGQEIVIRHDQKALLNPGCISPERHAGKIEGSWCLIIELTEGDPIVFARAVWHYAYHLDDDFIELAVT